ncbi:MAG: hypothetical protein KBT11_01435 [Treponema sp.]|nr:hypothetical protein [Candidatus Treponema equifaecale]
MKKLNVFAFAMFAASSIFVSCGSTSTLKGNAPIMDEGTPVVIDYQGKALGSPIPAWVVAMGDGNQKKIRKSLELDNDTAIFALNSKGNDLDFLKTWTDQVDARAEVASSIEQTVGQTVQSELNAVQIDDQRKTKAAKLYSSTMTNLTLNGLQKEAAYWIKTRTPKPGVKKPATPADWTEEYTYYVVYTMGKDMYQLQLKKALDDVEDNDDQTIFLKSVLTEKLTQTIVTPEQTMVNYDNAKVEVVEDKQ